MGIEITKGNGQRVDIYSQELNDRLEILTLDAPFVMYEWYPDRPTEPIYVSDKDGRVHRGGEAALRSGYWGCVRRFIIVPLARNFEMDPDEQYYLCNYDMGEEDPDDDIQKFLFVDDDGFVRVTMDKYKASLFELRIEPDVTEEECIFYIKDVSSGHYLYLNHLAEKGDDGKYLTMLKIAPDPYKKSAFIIGAIEEPHGIGDSRIKFNW